MLSRQQEVCIVYNGNDVIFSYYMDKNKENVLYLTDYH